MITNDMTAEEREENTRLLKEIFSSERRNTAFDIFYNRIKSRRASVYKTLRILQLSEYDISDLKDTSISTLGNIFIALGVCGLLYRRQPIIRTWVQIGLFYISARYLRNFYAYEQGLYRQAVFGDDQRSQEIRLLINHHCPQNRYRRMIVEVQLGWKNKH